MEKKKKGILLLVFITIVLGAFILFGKKDPKELMLVFVYHETLDAGKTPDEVETIVSVFEDKKNSTLFYPHVTIQRGDLVSQDKKTLFHIETPEKSITALKKQVKENLDNSLPSGKMLEIKGTSHYQANNENLNHFFLVEQGDSRIDNENYFGSSADIKKRLTSLIQDDALNTQRKKLNTVIIVIEQGKVENIELAQPSETKIKESGSEIIVEKKVEVPVVILEDPIDKKGPSAPLPPPSISIDLNFEGKNRIVWNPEIQEGDIKLTYTYSWSEGKNGPVHQEKIIRTVYKGSSDYINGSYTICPESAIEKKLHGIPVKITLETKINGRKKSNSKSIPKNTFYCKC